MSKQVNTMIVCSLISLSLWVLCHSNFMSCWLVSSKKRDEIETDDVNAETDKDRDRRKQQTKTNISFDCFRYWFTEYNTPNK